MFHLRFWSLAALLIFIQSCSQGPLSGNIKNMDSEWESTIYLIEAPGFDELYSSYEGIVIDSAKISGNGSFNFTKAPAGNEEKILLLAIQKKGESYANKLNTARALTANFIPFLWSPGSKIRIESDASTLMKNAKISGGPEANNEIKKLILKQIGLQEELHNELEKYTEEDLLENEKALFDYQNEFWNTAADNNSLQLLALALRMAAPNRDYERIPEILAEACTKMKDSDPEHAYTQSVCAMSGELPLKQGDVIPDFDLPMSEGGEKSLYSMMGKKLTLIDLWASWCAPCRIENRNTLVPLWDSYHKDGFEIIAYALDADYGGWTAAIEKDGAYRWPHASHLDGDDSPFLDRLRVSVIPANYILDENGVILGKNLHGEELVEFVNDYFSE